MALLVLPIGAAWSGVTRASDRASLTPRLRGGRSAGISDGNRDGNGGSRQRIEAAMNSHVLSKIWPELGIRYT